ncbi:MAG: SHOCT domain-containing protein [Candidatus Promineifilaceae bacterium]
MRRRGARRAGRRAARRTMRRRMVLPMGRRYRRRRFLVGGFTMLLVGGAAYKLGQSSVKQIEQYTGKPAEDLSEQELEAAMDHLGIEEEELTDADKAAIEAESVDAPAPGAPAPAEPDYISELERLAGLVDKGIITQEEFEAKKKSLLGL